MDISKLTDAEVLQLASRIQNVLAKQPVSAALAPELAEAQARGITDGTRPGEALTRQQLVAILYRYAQLMGYPTTGAADTSTFPDHATVSAYAKDAMAWAVGNGIVTGTSDGRLNPGGTASRAQFAVIMYRFDQKFAN